ncbi:DUF2312 domain-containing protein, partial [Microbacteriaceae bacterium K1510]|nr:DUF2312 domain-containing protein [Microbacteriaceae bacterium K1510]
IMGDERGAEMGGNSKQVLRERVRRRVENLKQQDELKEEMKDFKAEDKADGFTEKAIAQVVKEMRKGVDFQSDQLQLELEVDTYRKANDLPVTLAEAQKLAHEAD